MRRATLTESCFQFLGIPPKGELPGPQIDLQTLRSFQFLRIPPKGEHGLWQLLNFKEAEFPISTDPPEGGTFIQCTPSGGLNTFVSNFYGSPRRGNTLIDKRNCLFLRVSNFYGSPRRGNKPALRACTPLGTRFQFLRIPPKGELVKCLPILCEHESFQFLRIPPKGEHQLG